VLIKEKLYIQISQKCYFFSGRVILSELSGLCYLIKWESYFECRIYFEWESYFEWDIYFV